MNNRKVSMTVLVVLLVAVALFMAGAVLILVNTGNFMLQAGLVFVTVSELAILSALKFIEKKYRCEEQKTDKSRPKRFWVETLGGSLISLLLYCLLAYYVSLKNPAILPQRLIPIGFLILLALFILGDVIRWVRYVRHCTTQGPNKRLS